MKKNNQKSYIYPVISISVVIIIFAILNLWSVGDFENYKKISEFRNGLLSKDFKFKQFPPNELLGVKLYDDFEKYLLVNKSEIKIEEINNNNYYRFYAKKIKSISPFPGYFKKKNSEIYAKENGEIVGIMTYYEISLNGNNLLNFCTKARNSFLKQHNLLKLNFENEYYFEDDDEFLDFKKVNFLINNNNTSFSIVCAYDINLSSIRYGILFFLYDVNLWKDLISEYDLKITSKKINNNDIRKYRDKRKKKQ